MRIKQVRIAATVEAVLLPLLDREEQRLLAIARRTKNEDKISDLDNRRSHLKAIKRLFEEAPVAEV